MLLSALGVLIVCFALFLLFVGVIWIAADARMRGKPAVPVVLLSFVFFPLGLLIWIIFRPEPLHPAKPPFRLEDRRVQ